MNVQRLLIHKYMILERKLDTCGSPSPIPTSDFLYSPALRCRAGVARAAASRALLVPFVCQTSGIRVVLASEGIRVQCNRWTHRSSTSRINRGAKLLLQGGGLVLAAAAITAC
jgi:hypothetical protein